jgi:hypothetical protein
MSTPTYTITNDEDSGLSTATVIFNDGSTIAVNSTNTNYAKIVQAIVIDGADEEEVRLLMQPGQTVGATLRALSERVRVDNGNIFFDGDLLDNSLAKHIVRILEEGEDDTKWRALVNFMEKLYTNPSQKSIASLYEFLVRQNITILPDGDFIAYKGLNRDGSSIHKGYGIVNGKVFSSAHLPNPLGATVEIPRSKVDADTSVGCSTGLHAGSYKYAHSFAQGLLVTVKINPRDVVSVPDDAYFQKIRTARYVVLEQTELEDTRTTYGEADDEYDEDDWDADEDYDGDAYEEAENDLEEFRRVNRSRDFEAEPLTFEEVEILAAAQGQDVPLDGEEEDALDAYNEAQFDAQGGLTVTGFSNTDKVAQDGASFSKAADHAVAASTVSGADLLAKPAAPAPSGSRTVVGLTKPSNADFERQLQAEIDGEEDIVLTFDYTRGDGSQTTVEKFSPEDIERRGTDLLITGRNADGLYRSYYYGRMENLSVRDADTEPKHAS